MDKHTMKNTLKFKANMPTVLLLMLLCLWAAPALPGADAPAAEKMMTEAELIAVLKSDVGLKEKVDACRLLTRVGTEKCVPTLAALLADEKLAHMARYALEPNASPAVDAALLKALGGLKGRLKAGVIGSLGVRRYAPAIDALAGLLMDPDKVVAKAAGRALGRFGTEKAARALEEALDKGPAENRLAMAEGLLRCAEVLAADRQKKRAIAIYDKLRDFPGAHQVRTAALRGAVLTRPLIVGLPIMMMALRDKDLVMANAAVRTSMALKGPAITKALADMLDKIPTDNQVVLIKALGERRDTEALPALSALLKTGNKVIRQTIVHALAEIGHASVIPILIELLADETDAVAKAAKDALGSLSTDAMDSTLKVLLRSDNAKTRAMAMDLVSQKLLQGGLDGKAWFPKLAAMLAAAQADSDIQSLEKLLSALCVRYTQPMPGEVTIIKAVYGKLPDGPSADVTKKVADIIAKGSLSIQVSNANFGDPAKGIPKQFKVTYKVKDKTGTKTLNEGATLQIEAGTTPKAFIDALQKALLAAEEKGGAALKRILKKTRT